MSAGQEESQVQWKSYTAVRWSQAGAALSRQRPIHNLSVDAMLYLMHHSLVPPVMVPAQSRSITVPGLSCAIPASGLGSACCKAYWLKTREERHDAASPARSNTANENLKLKSYPGQSTGDDCSADSHLICVLSMTEITVPLSRAASSLG